MANLQFSVHVQRLDEPKERGAATTSAALDWLGVLGGKSGLVHGEFRGFCPSRRGGLDIGLSKRANPGRRGGVVQSDARI